MQHQSDQSKDASSNPQARSNEFVSQASERVLQMLQTGVATNEILTRLVRVGEAVAGPDATVSILVLDKDGLLRNAASPGLPADYLKAINGLKPDAKVGTCAAAAATGAAVMTPDFRADNKWAELRHWPLSLGYVGAWSVPIKSSEGKVLGTFGTYFRKQRIPTPEERGSIEQLAQAAALVLERK